MGDYVSRISIFKVPSVVRWCTIHLLCFPTMTLVGRHVLGNIKNKLLECSVQECVFPYSLCYFVYVYVICSACYLSVMIQLVSFPLSQYDLQLYALELFGQEWLDTPTKGRRSVLSESKRLQLGESCLENAWTSQVVTWDQALFFSFFASLTREGKKRLIHSFNKPSTAP